MNLPKHISYFDSFNWKSSVNKNMFQKNISNRALYPKKSWVLSMGWEKIIFNENFYKKYPILWVYGLGRYT